jgi:tRNA pseudouridine55 synthase
MIGFINLHKTTGMTSHDCVYQIRKSLKIKRVGHGGTLDPAASGVLSIAVGGATRLLSYLSGQKVYEAIIRLGVITTTDDLEGDILYQCSASQLTIAQVVPQLSKFIGKIAQVPPAYSAISVGGVRLYEKARKGEVFEIPTRQVEIYTIELIDWLGGEFPELKLKITCAPGTYIRSIARDLGKVLGVGGTLAGLIRLESGGFILEESISLEQLHNRLENGIFSLISPEVALKHLDKVDLLKEETKYFLQGREILLNKNPSTENCLVFGEGEFLGVGQRGEQNTLNPKVVLFTHP